MILIKRLTKQFGEITAVNAVDLELKEGEVFGLIGTNGAGKSTLLRMIAGIYRPDFGVLTVDGEPVFENTAAKQKVFYLSDDQYYFRNDTPADVGAYYALLYPEFDTEELNRLFGDFGLDKDRKLRTFSKGMRKQVFLLCGLCSGARYLLLDETFDGLDPVVRQAAKSLIARHMIDRQMTPVIASHNLRELEDICDHVGLLHKGGIILSEDILSLRSNIHRVQCVLRDGMLVRDLEGLDVVRRESRGRIQILTVRGDVEAVREVMEQADPVFYEILPLTLEEIFINETEVIGYDVKSLVF